MYWVNRSLQPREKASKLNDNKMEFFLEELI